LRNGYSLDEDDPFGHREAAIEADREGDMPFAVACFRAALRFTPNSTVVERESLSAEQLAQVRVAHPSLPTHTNGAARAGAGRPPVPSNAH
jgi:hypothetical protein